MGVNTNFLSSKDKVTLQYDIKIGADRYLKVGRIFSVVKEDYGWALVLNKEDGHHCNWWYPDWHMCDLYQVRPKRVLNLPAWF